MASSYSIGIQQSDDYNDDEDRDDDVFPVPLEVIMEEGGSATSDGIDTRVSQNEIKTASYLKRQVFLNENGYGGEWKSRGIL